MDAVQFGRWLSDRRRKYGWRSQRVLVETINQDVLLKECGISEDFLARLEAGQLAHPFRGSVRKRVFSLARLLCKTPRDLQAYLQAAELTDLSAEEADEVKHLRERLAAKHPSTVSLLPPRPLRLLGREEAVRNLREALCCMETGLCALSGMPGVGKSALAYETVHTLTRQQRERCFPEGIATFTCTGRRGQRGLAALLHEIMTFFASAPRSLAKTKRGNGESNAPFAVPTSTALASHIEEFSEADLAELIDGVRIALAGKRVLLLLDDLDAQFPLRQALEALLMREYTSATAYGSNGAGSISRVVFTTSRYIPPPALMTYHLHVGVLEPDAALELFTTLLKRELSESEYADAQRICAAVGHLPLAIEAAASSARVAGVPLSLLAERATQYPLDRLLDGEGEIRARLSQAFGVFDQAIQKQFVLLSALGAPSFGLESVAMLHTTSKESTDCEPLAAHEVISPQYTSRAFRASGQNGNRPFVADVPLTLLANTAADLGQFVRHSLVELVSQTTPAVTPTTNAPSSASSSHYPRYRLHPLLYTYAMDRLEQLEPEVVRSAQQNAYAYALAYVEHYGADVDRYECEQEFLQAALMGALRQGHYALVIRLLARLLPLLGRLGTYEKGERLLHWGIYASQQIHDQQYHALFLSHLGTLLGHRGDFKQARRVLGESLAIAETLEPSKQVWTALSELSHIACILGEREAAHSYIDTYLHHSESNNNLIGVAGALYMRGYYWRLDGNVEKANADLTASLGLISAPIDEDFCEDTFVMALRVEQARIRGEYALSQQYTQGMEALSQRSEDPYITADFLFDQACFIVNYGALAEARTLLLRVLDMAKRIGATYLYTRATNMLRQLPDVSGATTTIYGW